MERLCNSPPASFAAGANPVFYKDPGVSYGKNFLMGMDFDFLMLETCILCLMNQFFRNLDGMDVKFLMGILIAYAIDCFLI